jgi:hypothetical protein
MSYDVYLTDGERFDAESRAIKQDENCQAKGYKDNHDYGAYPEWLKRKNSKEGLMSEKAAAKLLGMPWPANNRGFKDADIGDDIQVRSTHYRTGHLIVRADDILEHKYVLVLRNNIPYFRVVGWILCKDAHKDEWWRRPDPEREEYAWCVPQSFLNPMSLLKPGLVEDIGPLSFL